MTKDSITATTLFSNELLFRTSNTMPVNVTGAIYLPINGNSTPLAVNISGIQKGFFLFF